MTTPRGRAILVACKPPQGTPSTFTLRLGAYAPRPVVCVSKRFPGSEVDMFELAMHLELKRQALARRVLARAARREKGMFGMAFIVLVAGLLPIWLFPSAAVATIPPEIAAFVALCVGGFMLAITVVGIPASLVLF